MKMKLLLIVLAMLAGLVCTSQAQTAEPPKDGTDALQDVTFKSVAGKDALATLGRTLGLKVTFDQNAKSRGKLDFALHKVTMRQALSVVLVLQDWSAKYTDDQTIVVYADTPEAQQKYGGLKDWSYKQP